MHVLVPHLAQEAGLRHLFLDAGASGDALGVVGVALGVCEVCVALGGGGLKGGGTRRVCVSGQASCVRREDVGSENKGKDGKAEVEYRRQQQQYAMTYGTAGLVFANGSWGRRLCLRSGAVVA